MKKLFLFIFATLLIVGCGGIGENIINETKRLGLKVKNIDVVINNKEKKFKEDVSVKTFKEPIEKEQLFSYFENAKLEAKRAKETYFSLKQLVDKNKNKDRKIALAKINSIKTSLLQINDYLKYPFDRLKEYKNISKNHKNLLKELIPISDDITSNADELVNFINSQISDNNNTYRHKEDLKNEISLINDIKNRTKSDIEIMTKLSKNKLSKVLLFLKKYKDVEKNKKEIYLKEIEIKNKINQLNHSYTKILKDMKEEYFIVVASTSWDDYYDYPNEHTRTIKTSKVSADVYKFLSNYEGVLATYSNGVFSGLKVKIPSGYWNSLHINSSNILARGDTDAEIWVQDAPVKFYHKYIIIKDDNKTETGWIEVNESTYEMHYNDLGMSIMTKPYGYYESEMIKSATPAGIAFVNNPKYGEWRQDNSGHSFWYYYGIYSFLNGSNGYGYSRDTYNGYSTYHRTNRNRSYYGKNNQYGTFSRANKIKRNRYFSRRNRSFSRRTVRTAGRASRGRGPGGGGK